jgi:hypothetical protein
MAMLFAAVHQGPQPERRHSEAEYMAAPNVSRKRQILFPCTAGAVHTCIHGTSQLWAHQLNVRCRRKLTMIPKRLLSSFVISRVKANQLAGLYRDFEVGVGTQFAEMKGE